MKLLFDQNLSFKIALGMKTDFPESIHVGKLGLEKENDFVVWQYAKDNDYTIITQDADFYDILLVRDFPPKIIWIKKGNCATKIILASLLQKKDIIKDFLKEAEAGCLEIY